MPLFKSIAVVLLALNMLACQNGSGPTAGDDPANDGNGADSGSDNGSNGQTTAEKRQECLTFNRVLASNDEFGFSDTPQIFDGRIFALGGPLDGDSEIDIGLYEFSASGRHLISPFRQRIDEDTHYHLHNHGLKSYELVLSGEWRDEDACEPNPILVTPGFRVTRFEHQPRPGIFNLGNSIGGSSASPLILEANGGMGGGLPTGTASACGQFLVHNGIGQHGGMDLFNGSAQQSLVADKQVMPSSQEMWQVRRSASGNAILSDSITLQSNSSLFEQFPGAPLACLASSIEGNDCYLNATQTQISVSDSVIAAMVGPELHILTREGLANRSLSDEDTPDGFGDPRRPIVCADSNEVYFYSTLRSGDRGSELFVARNDGSVEQLSNFAQIRADNNGLGAKTIRGFSLGLGCDALVMATNGDGSGGLYLVTAEGATARILSSGHPMKTDRGLIQPKSFRPHPSHTESLNQMGANGRDARGKVIDRHGNVALWVEDTNSNNAFLIRAEPPSDDCRVPMIVNTVDDGEDVAVGDGLCDIGLTISDGSPACSLRAAIQEANASTQFDTIEFDLPAQSSLNALDGLTPIRRDLFINAAGLSLNLDGRNITDSKPVIEIESGALRINGLSIRSAAQDGILVQRNAHLKLEQLSISDSGAWGIRAHGPIEILGTAESPVRISQNGSSQAAGGILLLEESAPGQFHNILVESNAGPGILANARVRASHSRFEKNDGAGINLQGSNTSIESLSLNLVLGETRFSENKGHGIFLDNAKLQVSPAAALISRNNAGWGIFADGQSIRFGENHVAPRRSRIEQNGQNTAVTEWYLLAQTTEKNIFNSPHAGGIFLAQDSRSTESDLILWNADIIGNKGPGILTTGSANFRQLSVKDNLGDGISMPALANASPSQLILSFGVGILEVSGNQGHGLNIESGSVKFSEASPVHIELNAGYGYYSSASTLTIEDAYSTTTGFPSRISNNGFGQQSCIHGGVDENGDPASQTAACISGGLYLDDGNLNATALHVVGNQGPGIKSTAGASFDGDVSLTTGRLCQNNPDLDVEGALNEQAVERSCSD